MMAARRQSLSAASDGDREAPATALGGLASKVLTALAARRTRSDSPVDNHGARADRAVDDIHGILARAQRAGIDPQRVIIALGIDRDDHAGSIVDQ